MDRMGQEIAFKGIDLSSQYVPAFSLSAGQHARVNFGQVRRLLLFVHKCTKHEFIHLLTATFKDLHIENSKNYKRRYCPHHTVCC